ncbi:MAG: glycosyltransferase [Patescibacteria group bacterium]
MKSSLIILTRNEIDGVRAIFSGIPFEKFDESFAVDYKSNDGTVEYFKERGIRVMTQEKKGRGEAFRVAAREARGDILIFFSPDGNENPADTIKLKEIIEGGGCDMAIASRFLPQSRSDDLGSLFPYRSLGNKFFTFLADLFFGGNLSDSINGFRAIRRDVFDKLKIDAEGFAIEYQMSIRAMKLGCKIKEIPTFEKPRIGGKSTAKTFPTGIKFLKLLFREISIGKNF